MTKTLSQHDLEHALLMLERYFQDMKASYSELPREEADQTWWHEQGPKCPDVACLMRAAGPQVLSGDELHTFESLADEIELHVTANKPKHAPVVRSFLRVARRLLLQAGVAGFAG
jgi:hypothetical protein